MGYEMGALPNAITNNEQRTTNNEWWMVDIVW